MPEKEGSAMPQIALRMVLPAGRELDHEVVPEAMPSDVAGAHAENGKG